MQINITTKSPTVRELNVVLDASEIDAAKERALAKLGKEVKVSGFRPGKAPAKMVEQSIDQEKLQQEVIMQAVNAAYVGAITEQNIRPVSDPKLEISKFVPFSTLEFKAEIDVIGEIKVADYKKLKKTMPKSEVLAAEVDEVISNMRRQMAKKVAADRPAKDGDEVVFDFKGTDEKGEAVAGAEGKDYPLALGSKTFIPGFEENLIGVKAGEQKTFTLTFPKDYGVKALQNRKVTFACAIKTVNEVEEPVLDDKFAALVNPEIKSVKELKEDVKAQLSVEKKRQTERDFENEVINELAEKSTVDLPQGLVDEQADSVLRELRQNLAYRGMTFPEYLEAAGMTDEEQLEKEILPEAKRRLKAGLMLTEIAEKEGLTVSETELNARIDLYKQQYKSDPQMQSELDKAEAKSDIMARLMTEKTIKTVLDYVKGGAK